MEYNGTIYCLSWMDEDGYYYREYESSKTRENRIQQLHEENRKLPVNSEFRAVGIRKYERKSEALAGFQRQEHALALLFQSDQKPRN